MRVSKGLGFVGASAVVSATVMIPAAASAGTTYNSTATASAGSLTVVGKQIPISSPITATDKSVTANTGVNALNGALTYALGSFAPLAESFLQTGVGQAQLVTESATATPDGYSNACAGFLTSTCATGRPVPITITIPLGKIPGLNLVSGPAQTSSGTSKTRSTNPSGSGQLLPSGILPSPLQSPLSGLGGVAKALGSAGSGSAAGTGQGSKSSAATDKSSSSAATLGDYTIVVTVSGPEVACHAGPSGTSGPAFAAVQSPAAASVEILRSGTPVVGPIALKPGNILSQLPQQLPAPLPNLSHATPVNLVMNQGTTSREGEGPVTTAAAGEVSVTVSSTQLLDMKGAKATCGANTVPGAGNGSGSGSGAAGTTSSETPLGGGIQTDEGRSGSGSGDMGVWAPVISAGIGGGAASGLLLWRRRRSVL